MNLGNYHHIRTAQSPKPLILQLFILVLGLALLYFGSSMLVEGAASTAVLFHVRPVIVGLTVVSLATSAPELLVSLVAAVKGSGGISLGNIIGSNVINIALVLGISGLIRTIQIQRQIIRIEIPYMIGVSIVFWALCVDSRLGRLDGAVLLILLFTFILYGIITARDKDTGVNADPPSRHGLLKHAVFIVLGILMLSLGANFVVREAIAFASLMGLSQTFIGISVVALGTSLPELATSAVAAARHESDISVGNVVGSNLFNICLVMGMMGLFNPMAIEANLHEFQFPFMVAVCVILGIVALGRREIDRISGLMMIGLFVFYLCVSYFK